MSENRLPQEVLDIIQMDADKFISDQKLFLRTPSGIAERTAYICGATHAYIRQISVPEKPPAPHPGETPQKVLRWVVASERLPKLKETRHFKYEYPGYDVSHFVGAYIDYGNEKQFVVSEGMSFGKDRWEYLFWLEEYESPAAQPEEVKEYGHKTPQEFLESSPHPVQAMIDYAHQEVMNSNLRHTERPIHPVFRGWDSKKLIGRSRGRFNELNHKGWDWGSFYNGWIEGRSDALGLMKEDYESHQGQRIPSYIEYRQLLEKEIAEALEIPDGDYDYRYMEGRKSGLEWALKHSVAQPAETPASGEGRAFCPSCRHPHKIGLDVCPWCKVSLKEAVPAQQGEESAGGIIEVLCHTLEELQKTYRDEWEDFEDEQITNAIALAKWWEEKDRYRLTEEPKAELLDIILKGYNELQGKGTPGLGYSGWKKGALFMHHRNEEQIKALQSQIADYRQALDRIAAGLPAEERSQTRARTTKDHEETAQKILDKYPSGSK